MKINKLRQKINKIDKKIIKNLSNRFLVTKKVAEYKLINNVKINNLEVETKNKKNLFDSGNIKYLEIYDKILDLSKKEQMLNNKFKIGLIGKSISYSMSPKIHEIIANKLDLKYDFYIIDIQNSNQIEDYINLLKNYEYLYFNVTIPYKEEMFKYVDIVTQKAFLTRSINTVYFDGLNIIGDNTDYYGFCETIKKRIDLIKKTNVLILGNGATARVIKLVLDNLSIKNIIYARHPKDNENLLDNIYENKNNFSIVNATPVGTYPNINDTLLKEEFIIKADYVMDVIYNPKKTKLLKSFDKECDNGLKMLIYQALYSFKIVTKQEFNINDLFEVIYNELNI